MILRQAAAAPDAGTKEKRAAAGQVGAHPADCKMALTRQRAHAEKGSGLGRPTPSAALTTLKLTLSTIFN